MFQFLHRAFDIRIRSLILMLVDTAIIAATVVFSIFVSNIAFQDKNVFKSLLSSTVLIVFVYIIILILFGCYNSLWRYAQAREFFYCLLGCITAGIVYLIFEELLVYKKFPLYFYFLIIFTSAFAMVASRLSYRYYREVKKCKNISNIKTKTKKKRALIIGGGTACLMLLNEVSRRHSCDFVPVTIVDQDISKKWRSIGGLMVEGTMDDIEVLCQKHKIDLIIVAIPSANNKQRAKILEKCSKVNVKVQMMPYLSSFYEGEGGIVDKLRDIMPEELLGRDEISLSNEELIPFLKDKTVLVTGGGGSIGSELCRQIAESSPKRLIVLDIYENNAYEIQQELYRRYGSDIDLVTLIASVRDKDKMSRIFAAYKPDIVFHAAAHKHVPLMEVSPDEAIKNNIFGTYNVASAAMENKVSKFIFISTDKAVNPTNIMGASKRVCEMIVQSSNGLSSTVFAAVRFGNVLGSNGSVIPLFKNQIAEGGPVTVTHPEVIRYFMTIPEAAKLVLTAGAMAEGGEIFILDMGKPVKIDDLAKKMIGLAGLTPGKDMEIKYTGLREGEKLYEELLMAGEGNIKTNNQKIFITTSQPADRRYLIQQLKRLNVTFNLGDNQKIEELMMEIVPTFYRYHAN